MIVLETQAVTRLPDAEALIEEARERQRRRRRFIVLVLTFLVVIAVVVVAMSRGAFGRVARPAKFAAGETSLQQGARLAGSFKPVFSYPLSSEGLEGVVCPSSLICQAVASSGGPTWVSRSAQPTAASLGRPRWSLRVSEHSTPFLAHLNPFV